MGERSWAILAVAMVTVLFSPLFISEYSKGQCRIETIKAGVEADKINVACGIKS